MQEGSEVHVAGLGAPVIALNAAVYGSPAALAAALVRAGRARRAVGICRPGDAGA